MGLFDAITGRIEHFNTTAVPALNNIFSRAQELPDETEKQLFIQALVIAQLSIDLFFKPGQGPVVRDVKKYNEHDFEQLYALFMIWVFYDFVNVGVLKQTKVKDAARAILAISEDKLTHYLQQLKHKDKTPMGLDKLWHEVVNIIHTMPNTQENYLVFARDFSRLCKGVFRQIED